MISTFPVVSFIGVDPYIQYNQNKQVVGGAEFEIISTYAKAYGFHPKLRREPTYDKSHWSNVDGQWSMVKGPKGGNVGARDQRRNPGEGTIVRGMVGSVGRKVRSFRG